jgi:predicted transcriptional regulator
MNTLSLKLPDAVHAKLSLVAKRRGATKSAVIREALQDYLARQGVSSPGSFAALAKDFMGCIDGGPADLSHNKKHMKGFGR